MSGTSEQELKKLLSSLHLTNGFLGTFDCRFPGFINKEKIQTAIVNTGPREEGGVHWIAMGWDPHYFKMYIFDPLGWKEKQLQSLYNYSYQGMIKRSALTTNDHCINVEKNTQAVQCTCSGACGLFCVFFLYCFYNFKGQAFKNPLFQKLYGALPSLTPLDPTLLHANQLFVYRFLLKKSLYFQENKEHLIRNTNVGLIKTH
ncbi:protease [Odocoileus adenovirus 1]|uniref:Protease n=2 Tax=Deer atadenovirus A TaxID=2169706 RepID=A0A515MFR8_9ADEN|nr:protease [Odocoileus adenovirus 1]QDM55324.1 protease [Deer atadenovirus A]ASU50478.1 protease [Odocoileus adenovirus 1]ASU50505.1 protease [Odocoileus adenovirus 1]ASU50532.1 protease [Odocoileus adenovirus 1]ASU50586.1 protease [Odocoileus adenovirus 1]